MLNLNLAHETDDALIVRVAWLYYVAGLNQEETASRLGLHRSRVNRSQARQERKAKPARHKPATRRLLRQPSSCSRCTPRPQFRVRPA